MENIYFTLLCLAKVFSCSHFSTFNQSFNHNHNFAEKPWSCVTLLNKLALKWEIKECKLIFHIQFLSAAILHSFQNFSFLRQDCFISCQSCHISANRWTWQAANIFLWAMKLVCVGFFVFVFLYHLLSSSFTPPLPPSLTHNKATIAIDL